MPHFVRDCEHVAYIRLIVQKHERVNAVAARAVRAAALAVRFLNVYPALVVALFQKRLILLAERRKPLNYILVRLVVVQLKVNSVDKRRVNIVKIQLIVPQKLFSVRNIAVHRGHIFRNCVQKILVNLSVDVLAEKRIFQARVEFVSLA